MTSPALIEMPDEYDLAIAEREAQTGTINPVTALLEARIQILNFRQSYPEAA